MEDAFPFYDRVFHLLAAAIGREGILRIDELVRLRTCVQKHLLLRGLGIVHVDPLPVISPPVREIAKFLQDAPGKTFANKKRLLHELESEDLHSDDDDEHGDSYETALDYGPFSDFIIGSRMQSLHKVKGRRKVSLDVGIMRVAGREYVFRRAFLDIRVH